MINPSADPLGNSIDLEFPYEIKRGGSGDEWNFIVGTPQLGPKFEK